MLKITEELKNLQKEMNAIDKEINELCQKYFNKEINDRIFQKELGKLKKSNVKLGKKMNSLLMSML